MEVKKMIKNEDGTYTWIQNSETIVTQEEFDKNKNHLEGNIKTIEKELRDLDIRKILAMEEKKVDFMLGVKKDSLKNFDKYWKELQASEEERKTKEKAELKQYIDHADGIKKKVIQFRKEETLRKTREYSEQLESHKKDLVHYYAHEEKKAN